MATGSPDYYRGMVLYGIFNDLPKQITVDSGGNLAAFLKAMYGPIPTPITCDENGNMNINVAVSATDFHVIPSDPEQNIPIKLGAGADDLKINIKSQDLGQVKTRPALGTYFAGSNTINPTSQTSWTVIELSGDMLIANLTINISSNAAQPNSTFTVYIDDASWAAMSFTEYRDFQFSASSGAPLLCTSFNDVSWRFMFALAKPIHCYSYFKILWGGNALNLGSLQSKFGYYKL